MSTNTVQTSYRCAVQVSKIYKDKSIGNPMHIAVVKLVVLRDIHFVENRNRMGGIVAADMLQKFCEWQTYHNDESHASGNHHDVAILLTRYDSNYYYYISTTAIISASRR